MTGTIDHGRAANMNGGWIRPKKKHIYLVGGFNPHLSMDDMDGL